MKRDRVNIKTIPISSPIYEAGPGIGFFADWRGKAGKKFIRGEPNQR